MSSTSILSRCLTFLEILADHPAGLALGELSDRTGVPKSATHRMLSSLVESGFVSQSAETRNYRLTTKLIALGFRFLGQTGLIEHCQEVLDRLALDTKELVSMTIVDGDKLVWIAKSQGARGSLVIDPVMGKDVVLHATANGKLWLASLSLEQALKLVLREGFDNPEDRGPSVCQSIEELIPELEAIKARGYATAWEEAEPGIAAVAVPILGPADKQAPFLGTVSVGGPISRLSKKKLQSLVPTLLNAAQELSHIWPIVKHWRDNVRTSGRDSSGLTRTSYLL